MNSGIVALGLFGVFLGLIILAIGSRSRGEMEIELGSFKGPVWFLIMIFGIFISVLGMVIP
jgi:hypothetical protein